MEGEHEGKAETKEAGGEEPPHQVTAESEKGTRAAVRRGLSRLLTRRAALVAVLLAALVSSFLYLRHNSAPLDSLKSGVQKAKAVLGVQPTPTPDPYAEAVSQVEADRGEPVGRQAQVEVPAELKQYADRHRFLAVQAAAANVAGVRTPHDFAELAEMIARGGELVEAPRLGRGYVLFGVGGAVTGELTHYDAKQGKSVPLFAGDDELKAYRDGLATERTTLEAGLKDTGAKLRATDRKDKEERTRLASDAAASRKALADLKEKEKLTASEYETPQKRQMLYEEYDTLALLARSFGGRAYDLHDPSSVREFQQRMLSFIRPAALAVLEELAQVYQTEFQRPLPVTSLVRTDEYQRLLRESGNANAGDFSVEPHTTGFAFDVYYHFMSAREQGFVMDEIAQFKKDGRVEALRELRDHYHVFAFPDGHAPDKKAVESEIKKTAKGK
ncbi:MAG TPA: DUF5715 family protein [Pyrinomonadaceae bacterium]|jgi:hypothetical protein|nr:DUF5715 family protein [Pyrinomonadaceae bacterium]